VRHLRAEPGIGGRVEQLFDRRACFVLANGTEVVIAPKGMTEDIVAVRRAAAYLSVDRWAVLALDGEPPE
jgi:hypothetical protein